MRYLSILSMLVVSTAWCDITSIGEDGIDSKVTGLDGTGIQIGQVEQGRAGKPGYDVHFAANTIPTGVYVRGASGMASPNFGVNALDPHATQVAGVMIGKDTPELAAEGVAPNAELHSMDMNASDVVEVALALNRLALLNSGALKAINMSFTAELQPFIEEPDGNSHLPQYVDWSSRRHDILYVASWGNADSAEFRTPQDNFNGMTVAASESPPGAPDFQYRKFSIINSTLGDASGDRTSIDLLAPGFDIRVLGYGGDDTFENGSSLAAPHVTGAAALLHQYAEQQINGGNERFFLNPQKHEVMKAVMLNSADKLAGVHGSTRDVIDFQDQKWTESEAYNSVAIPLDDQMGAGHLNVRRAIQQFEPGEYGPGIVPAIGWDYGSIGGQGDIIEYVLDGPVAAEEYIAITLAWDRRIESTGGTIYNFGDDFLSHGVANLDLRLMTKDGTDLVLDSVWSSQSFEDNVEHIFFKFDEQWISGFGDEYKIVVHH
jgi:subtilisin family serine protease